MSAPRRSRRRARGAAKFSFTGFLLFFAPMTLAVSAAVLIHSSVSGKEWATHGAIAAIMLAVIAALSLLCAAIDTVRRTLTSGRPAAQILEATDRIASGDFSVRLIPGHPFGRYSDYDKIMANINRMAAELSKTEVLRTDFVADVSHEIKTPLAVIQSYAAALGGELPAETRREYAAALASASARLSALVSDILKLNKLENSELRPEAREFDLSESVRACVLGFEDILERKALELACDIDDVRICGDEALLSLVWNNLLSNAVKFTPAGGTVRVSLRAEENGAVLSVQDTGCGISPETGAHIFDKFYQGDTSHAQEGNGLGLALVKKVIDIVGGEVSVESAPGKGSTFTVRLRADVTNRREEG